MFTRILVPLDGSRLAERAIPHALCLAKIFNAKIFLLHILDPSQFQDTQNTIDPFNWQLRKAEAELYLTSIEGKIQNQGVDVTCSLLEGRTSESIIDFAHQEKMDLLVLSTHGASGFSRWNMSSVVTKVIEKVYLPLFIIRSYQEMGPMETEWDENRSQSCMLYERILLPFDSSRRAEYALPVASALSQGDPQKQPKLILAAVLKPPEIPLPAPYPAEIHQNILSLMQTSREAVASYLTEMGSRVATPCETRIVENISVPSALHSLAAEENVDLVILSAHGHTGPAHWPYGSVAQNYIEHGEKHLLLLQDTHPAQVRPTAAEVAAEKYGRR